ncbi:MAG: hypothetical protein DRI90_03000 [Deltaproteobacteria bacterium]|nr:MAG: hypothetical protein DRI90_03000 [Deltaproteobacteria bacterium]
MNERQRFRRLMRGQPVDRPPRLEEGVREQVIDRWHREGLDPNKTHAEVFGLTEHERVGPDIRQRSSYRRRVMALSHREYRKAFDVAPDRFPDDWPQILRRLEDRAHVACIWAFRGFFQALGVEDWATLKPVLQATLQDPVDVRARLEMYGEFCATLLDQTLAVVDPEFIYLGEAISDNKGPLISPAMFEEFVIPVYRRLVAVAHAHGCREILVGTYGNSARLLPAMRRAGVTMLWISEAAESPETDYRTIRRQHGPELGLIGGVPLSLLRATAPDDLRLQLETLVTPLLSSGRYIPLAGGRVREEIPWPVYRVYREVLDEIMASPSNCCGPLGSCPGAHYPS